MRSVAFVTCRKLNGIAPDDAVAVTALERRGVRVEGVIWDDPSADWTKYVAIVLRSCWDYFYDPPKFAVWIDKLTSLRVRVFNSLPTVRWNHDKTYLRDLEQRGIKIAHTFWCERGTAPSIQTILAQRGWTKAVVKPTISGTSMHTWVASQGDQNLHDAELASLLGTRDMMIQEFVPEILEGEWSLIFFRGEFSHAAVKRAKPGDFRVQDEFGGTWAQESASPELVTQARQVLECVDEDLLYARVDGIARDGTFLLMELEVIEPMLYFGANIAAGERFADALLQRL